MEDAAVLLPHLPQLWLDRITLKADRGTHRGQHDQQAACPGCGATSARVHSRYIRQLVDSAIGGREVPVALRERRLFCDQTGEARAQCHVA